MKKYFVFVVLAVSFFLLSACGGTETVNLEDYTTVEYYGMDGKGHALVEVQYEDIVTQVLGERSEVDQVVYDKMVVSLMFAATADWEKEDGLSNGDMLNVTYTVNEAALEELGIEVESATASFPVSGLQEPVMLDAFLDVKIYYENYAPCVTATVVNNSTHEFLRDVRYTLDKSSNLDNGDIITVTAEYSIYEAESQGYMLISDTAEYVVENMPFWITNAEQVTSEAREVLKKQAEDLVTAVMASYSGTQLDTALTGQRYYTTGDARSFTQEDPRIVGEYFLAKKDTTANSGKPMNEYVYLFEVPVVITKKRTSEVVYNGSAFLGVRFEQMVANAEGTVNPNVNTGKVELISANMESILKSMVISKVGDYAMHEFSQKVG